MDVDPTVDVDMDLVVDLPVDVDMAVLREQMLERVHEGHLGIDRCKRRVREVMFWTGMSAEVERVARRCKACALHAPRPRRQPLLQHHVPDLP
ncbi:unnamed protein product [Parnassius apollo]|uniref:RNA-directed DNA polymerase n=1 Tax=Parnassius apollo TaxID=110799 RepID=A0A8S3WDB5_PARAO|nr:unnamed protein product [Parnassius apollo]